LTIHLAMLEHMKQRHRCGKTKCFLSFYIGTSWSGRFSREC